jgi:hypothetical protein
MAVVETYERAHGQRVPVLRKLRYLRCDEPAGYDALSPDEVSAALRLRNRDSVLAEIERLRVPFRRPAEAQRSA